VAAEGIGGAQMAFTYGVGEVGGLVGLGVGAVCVTKYVFDD